MAWALERGTAQLDALLDLDGRRAGTGLGPLRRVEPYVDRLRAAGLRMTVQAGTVAEAVRAERAGADLVVARGAEGGGHGRDEVGSLPLLQGVLDRVEVPVVAAGGIGTPRGLAAVLAAGAAGCDAAIGGRRRRGTPGATSDDCPTPPGATGDGCVVSGRVSRLRAEGDGRAGPEQVLVEDWCQQYPSHSDRRARVRGRRRALRDAAATARASTSSTTARAADPPNPCGDPPGGVGGALSPPTAEGGALRSQDLRTSGDPAG